MRLNAQDLVRAYEFLRLHKPFNEWPLPESEAVRFKVVRSRMTMGEYDVDPHTVLISRVTNENWMQVLETMAHEMVHMACERKDYPGHPEHDAKWKRLASQVCRQFGWKLETF